MQLDSVIVSVTFTILLLHLTSSKDMVSSSDSTWYVDDLPEDANRVSDDIASDDITDKETAREKNTISQEGDMHVTKLEQLAEKGKVQLDEVLEDLDKWPSTVIPYVFGKSFNGQRAIKAAFKHYAERSCITFRPKRPEDKDFLYFYNGRGCWSFVGRIGGKQHISLPHYCRTTLGTPVHEILHALGFYHEQSRTDRDKYIEVEWENIKPRAKPNFEEHDQQDHGYPYDYNSVMHYSDHSFSRNGRITLKVLKGHHIIGQRRGMSQIDQLQLNAHYCGGKKGWEKKKREEGEKEKVAIKCNPEEGVACYGTENINEIERREKEIVNEGDKKYKQKLPDERTENETSKVKRCSPEEGDVCSEESMDW